MLEEGATLEEIGNIIGLTRQRIWQYTLLTGQYEKWKSIKEAKKIGKRIKRIKQDLLRSLLDYTIKRADEGGYGEALKYYFGKGRHRNRRVTTLEKIINLVKIYHQAQRDGEKLSYRELAEMTGIYTGNFPEPSMQHLLSEMGLPSLHWTPRRTKGKIIQDEKKEIMSAYPKMRYIKNYSDISYFTGISPPSVQIILGKKGGRCSRSPQIKSFGRGHLTWRGASQIYAFKDEFNAAEDEIADALGKDRKIIDYAVEHRDEIEPKIINDLRLMFPKEKIEKPYR